MKLSENYRRIRVRKRKNMKNKIKSYETPECGRFVNNKYYMG